MTDHDVHVTWFVYVRLSVCVSPYVCVCVCPWGLNPDNPPKETQVVLKPQGHTQNFVFGF
jgi:hypothetical protein